MGLIRNKKNPDGTLSGTLNSMVISSGLIIIREKTNQFENGCNS